MTGTGSLRSRLEWLRLLGVEDLGVRRASPLAPSGGQENSAPEGGGATRSTAAPRPGTPGPPAIAPPPGVGGSIVQSGLFGGAGEMEPSASKAAGRRPAPPGSASPLAGARPVEAADAATALRLIREDIGDCERCGLCRKRTHIVFGVGNPQARVMFVGEGPGADEDAQGEPFVGRAGQLLTKIIESMGMERKDVYIANVVKCRPPENRTPLPDEIGTCSPFLFRQILAIRPRVVVCLGTPAAQTVLGTRDTITRLRGAFHEVAGVRVMPTFHPAYLLRNPAAKKEVWDDMKKVMAELKTAE